MNTSSTSSSSAGHPAPKRHAIGRFVLWFGLTGGPFAWIVAEMANYFTAAHECADRSLSNAAGLTRASSPWFIGIALVTALITLTALWVAIEAWRRTREEAQGSGHHLLELGEGRTRFIAMAGLMTSIGFSVAYLFTIAYMAVAPLCTR